MSLFLNSDSPLFLKWQLLGIIYTWQGRHGQICDQGRSVPLRKGLVYTKMHICSPMDALQWMGAVRMRVQTADKHHSNLHKNANVRNNIYSLLSSHMIKAPTYFSPDSDNITFSLMKAILWRDDLYFSWKQWFEMKNILMMDLFIMKMWLFTSLESVWVTCGCFNQLFGLSFWRHPFTAEGPLVS